MAKQDALEIDRRPAMQLDPPFTGPRVPVRTDVIVGRIERHLVDTGAKQRLVRVGPDWVLLDIGQAKPADIEALGRRLGVMDQCEAMV